MFTKDAVHYGAPDPDDMLELRDERTVKLACPPEDCGGPDGYEDLIAVLAVLADPEHDEHEHMRNWVGLAEGVRFDPDRFDLDEANARVLLAMRRRSR